MCWTMISVLEKAGKASVSSMPVSVVDCTFLVSGFVVGVKMKITVAITSMAKIHINGCFLTDFLTLRFVGFFMSASIMFLSVYSQHGFCVIYLKEGGCA